MKLLVILFLLVLLQGTITTTHAQFAQTLAGAIDLDAISAGLYPTLKNLVFPVLVDAINEFADDNLQAETQEGDCCELGDFGVRTWLQVYNFRLDDDALESKLTVRAEPTGNNNSARIRIQARDVDVAVSAVTGVGAAALVPLECAIGVDARLVLPLVDVAIDIIAVEGTADLQLDVAFVRIAPILFTLTPIIDNICSVLSTLLASAFNTVSLALAGAVQPIVGTVFLDVLVALVPTIDIPLTDIINDVELPILNGVLTPALFIDVLAGTNEGVLVTEIHTAVRAELNAPEHRAGSKLAPAVGGELETVDDPDNLARVHLGFGGLNNAIEGLWYLLWASLAEDPNSLQSSLCDGQGTSFDPCPYPPLTVPSGDFDKFLVDIVFLFSAYSSYTYEIVVQPPRLGFDNGGLFGFIPEALEASAQASATITGNREDGSSVKLATITGGASVGVKLPDYDPVTGRLSDLGLSSIDLVSPRVEYHEFALLGFLFNLVVLAIDLAVDTFSGLVTGLANTLIDDLLADVPIKVPPIEGFPTNDTTIAIIFEGTFLTGAATTSEFEGYIALDAGLRLDVFGPPEAPSITQRTDVDDAFYQAAAYQHVYEWAVESGNPDAIFSATFVVDGTPEIHVFRWSPGGVETRSGDDEAWTLAPAPQ